MKRWSRVWAAFGALVLAGAAPVEDDRAADQALIVGTVAYADGFANPLIATYNDAALTAQTLRDRGMPRDAITVLTETPDAALLEAKGNPKLRAMPVLATFPAPSTRAAIMAAFQRLARNATAGSHVLIQLSGHGVQIPAMIGNEADGMDGAYLPVDARANGDRFANLITDDEIAQAVAAIRRKGATVTLLIATSHSGEFVDDLQRESLPGAVTGMVSTTAEGVDRAYLTPHLDYGQPQFVHSPMIVYSMLELARQRGHTPIETLDKAIRPWMSRHRVDAAIPFGRDDLPAL